VGGKPPYFGGPIGEKPQGKSSPARHGESKTPEDDNPYQIESAYHTFRCVSKEKSWLHNNIQYIA
jgi:hypothetical protein